MVVGKTVIYVVFEDRGDCCWATLNHFWTAAEAAGLEGDPTPVEELLVGVRRPILLNTCLACCFVASIVNGVDTTR